MALKAKHEAPVELHPGKLLWTYQWKFSFSNRNFAVWDNSFEQLSVPFQSCLCCFAVQKKTQAFYFAPFYTIFVQFGQHKPCPLKKAGL